MLEHRWEVLATELANASNETVVQVVADVIKREHLERTDGRPPRVVVGRDTRYEPLMRIRRRSD